MIGASLSKPNQIANDKKRQQKHTHRGERSHANQRPKTHQQIGSLTGDQNRFFGVEVRLGEIKTWLGYPLWSDGDRANGNIQVTSC